MRSRVAPNTVTCFLTAARRATHAVGNSIVWLPSVRYLTVFGPRVVSAGNLVSMGLVYQSRGVIHSRDPDRRETFARPLLWEVTGRNRTFIHYCQEGKSSSFTASQATQENLAALQNAFGFFSLTADCFERPDRARAYVLHQGQLREVNTRRVAEEEVTPPGLYQHFEWCRQCYYASYADQGTASDVFRWLPERSQQLPARSTIVDAAGWFFGGEAHRAGFAELLSLFSSPNVAVVTEASISRAPYLFVGEEQIALGTLLEPLLEASRRFPTGRGLLYLLGGDAIPQLAIAAGECRALAPLEFQDWAYHEDLQWNTGRFGYEPR